MWVTAVEHAIGNHVRLTMSGSEQSQLLAPTQIWMALISPRAIWRRTWAHPTEPSHRSPPTRLSGIISTKQKSSHIQSSAIHATNAEGFFFFFFSPDWRHLPFAFERLSKMCELTARCCSLPSEARSSFQSPERLLSKPSPLSDPPSLLCAVNFQRSIWLLNASGLKDESQQPDLSACSSYLYWGWSLSLSEEA